MESSLVTEFGRSRIPNVSGSVRLGASFARPLLGALDALHRRKRSALEFVTHRRSHWHEAALRLQVVSSNPRSSFVRLSMVVDTKGPPPSISL